MAVAVTLYIGAAVAVRHGGKGLPPWPTAGAALTVVEHDGGCRGPHRAADCWRSPYRRGSRRLVLLPLWPTAVGLFRRGLRRSMFIFDKFSNGRIILKMIKKI
jgi:hypothetical protein